MMGLTLGCLLIFFLIMYVVCRIMSCEGIKPFCDNWLCQVRCFFATNFKRVIYIQKPVALILRMKYNNYFWKQSCYKFHFSINFFHCHAE